QLDVTTNVRLAGELRAQQDAPPVQETTAVVRLSAEDGTELFARDASAPADGTRAEVRFDETVSLDPGSYVLTVFARSRFDTVVPPNGQGEASFDLVVTTGCPGDLDGDGEVNLEDLAILLAHFGTQTGARLVDGDLDGDGDVDLTDLTHLL